MRLRDMSASISFLHSTETQRTKKIENLLFFHEMIDNIPPTRRQAAAPKRARSRRAQKLLFEVSRNES